jgi:hypothetical protein
MVTRSAVLIALVWIAAEAGASDSDARARFLAEYAAHAPGLRQHYTGWEVRVKQTSRGGKDAMQELTYTLRYDHDFNICTYGERQVVSTKTGEVTASTPGSLIEGLNRHYGFQLSREKEGVLLRQVALVSDPATNPTSISFCPLCFPYASSFLRKTYLELAQDPATEVVSYRTADSGQRELVLRFSRTNRSTGAPYTWDDKYTLDPANGWVCTRVRTQAPGKVAYTEEIYHYQPGSGSPPAIKGWESWRRDGKDGQGDVRIASREILEARPNAGVSEDECRLSAFGLPEPVGVVWAKRTPRYVWFLAAAGAFTVLAVGFRYLARRRAKKEVAV